jgi:hypothetical protein
LSTLPRGNRGQTHFGEGGQGDPRPSFILFFKLKTHFIIRKSSGGHQEKRRKEEKT